MNLRRTKHWTRHYCFATIPGSRDDECRWISVFNVKMGKIMRKIMILVVLMSIICFIAGCGPGGPFEIEERNMFQSETQAQIAADR